MYNLNYDKYNKNEKTQILQYSGLSYENNTKTSKLFYYSYNNIFINVK